MSLDLTATEIKSRLEELRVLLERVKDASRYEDLVLRLSELGAKMEKEGFWDDAEAAKPVIAELKRNKAIVDRIDTLDADYVDALTMLELGMDEADEATLTEVEESSRALLERGQQLEVQTLLSGDYDSASCYLAVHAGAGGTESCDWVGMLSRMFWRWAEKNDYEIVVIDEQPGDEAGFKSVTLHIQGDWAYGYLRSEIGVHRLVRISPFDAKSRRHTSFASVDVSPEVEAVEVEIEESDLRIDTYRASGAGGQHVNTTDSAVRITHEPTGIVVQCQNERSQHSNRAAAMKVLSSRLLQLELKKREDEIAKITGNKGDIAFGSQIRSYVLAPYKMAKDHRTETETGNVDHVLDGDLDAFIEAFLRASAKRT
ncbi:MAG: peptide chain release factor 2 [Planctomycetota bacterium]